ncbi:DNA cytosine methyltransferase [Proteus terrae]|uniref:DNA cytosine methyltransferase n=1 Tax=Proteus terrae TaxID=1574161 RepID=UPI001C5EEDCC|nr:DNA cytosine methyltransferase [Proteus terrae]
MPNIVDLFCGCGGLSYGFELAGFKTVLGIDHDKAAIETFKINHKDAKTILGDIREVSNEEILNTLGNTSIDVVIGGPPCQGLSLSGPRQFDDPRNQLYLSFIRIVSLLKPKYVLIENVPGMVSLFKGRIKDEIIHSLEKLNYNVDYRILKASEYGVPQHRRRVFFVGSRDGNKFDFPAPTHNDSGDLLLKKMVTTFDALCDLPLLENSLGEEKQSYDTTIMNEYQKVMRKNSSFIYNHIAAKHSDKVKETIKLVPAGKNYKSLPKELRSSRNFNVAWTRFPDHAPSPTIDTGHRHHFHYLANRVPTVRECARLQSFPDCFYFTGNKTEQFRQVGNAVPPILAMALAKKIIEKL